MASLESSGCLDEGFFNVLTNKHNSYPASNLGLDLVVPCGGMNEFFQVTDLLILGQSLPSLERVPQGPGTNGADENL